MLLRHTFQYVPALSKTLVVPRTCSTRSPPRLFKVDISKSEKEWTLTDLLVFFHRLRELTSDDISDYYKKKEIKRIKDDQKFILERYRILGPELAAAHFIMFREGKVKFRGYNQWMTKENITVTKDVPKIYVPYFFIEEIDASETALRYEGFSNLLNLRGIKKLHLRNCKDIDDHCLHRTFLLQNTLEFLDLSGCENITERGLCSLHSLRKLKKLVIHNTIGIANKELACLMLQDLIPDLEIEGVSFDDPGLIKRLQKYSDGNTTVLETKLIH